MRPKGKELALEVLMMYVELDRAEPVVEEMLPFLSHKQPKIIAQTLEQLRDLFKAFGTKIVDPKPILKALPKVYGHADKSVRAKAQELTVELYRWLRDAMKPLFWADLKPVQQADLEKMFEAVKIEPSPQPTRLLRSHQAARTLEQAATEEADDIVDEGDQEEADLEPETMAVDVFPKLPKDFSERIISSKWKDRKEVLDDVLATVNVPVIEDGPFDEIVRALAKCMKDANVAVVTVAANCIELIAKGLRNRFAKYRGTVMASILERLKEKKQTVTDALAAALDAVFSCTNLSDCLDDILESLKHKNPQVKLETTRFLARCLRNTREAPSQPEFKLIADFVIKMLAESQEVQRNAAAEVLGVLWKIMGDRAMNPVLEGLDDIRKTKIKEYHDASEVKAKSKPKPTPQPPKTAAPIQKKSVVKKPTATVKKPLSSSSAISPVAESATMAQLQPKATARPNTKPAVAKPALAGQSGALRPPKKPLGAGPPTPQSRRPISSPAEDETQAPLRTTFGRGPAGRPLGKSAAQITEPQTAQDQGGLSAAERAELQELRLETERLRRQQEDWRNERTTLYSQLHELQNQNAQLIEDHTRDVLSIKAKETQLTRARSDYEAAEERVQSARHEIERLKREFGRQVRASGPSPPLIDKTGSGPEQVFQDTDRARINGNESDGRQEVCQTTSDHWSSQQRGRSGRNSPSEGISKLPHVHGRFLDSNSPGPSSGRRTPHAHFPDNDATSNRPTRVPPRTSLRALVVLFDFSSCEQRAKEGGRELEAGCGSYTEPQATH